MVKPSLGGVSGIGVSRMHPDGTASHREHLGYTRTEAH
jgi:hypothetical protein